MRIRLVLIVCFLSYSSTNEDRGESDRVTWSKNAGKYLSGYSAGTAKYDSLLKAQSECLKRSDCGGITYETTSKQFTLRRGVILKDSASEISWIAISSDDEDERIAPPIPPDDRITPSIPPDERITPPIPPLPEEKRFNQSLHAVIVSGEINLLDGWNMELELEFLATSPESDRSGGILEIKVSDNLTYKIVGCNYEGDFALPTITANLIQLRIVKKYPWIAVKCNGAIVFKENFFLFKEQECRSVWAIKANMVRISNKGYDAVNIEVSEQDDDEAAINDETFDRLYMEFFPQVRIVIDPEMAMPTCQERLPCPESYPSSLNNSEGSSQCCKYNKMNGNEPLECAGDQIEVNGLYFSFDRFPSSDPGESCKAAEDSGFIKVKCTADNAQENITSSTTQEKCPNSEEYYQIMQGRDDACVPVFYYSKLCSHDPHFYQACGHPGTNVTGKLRGLCNNFMCHLNDEEFTVRSDSSILKSKLCDGKKDCKNTDLDEMDCEPSNSCESGMVPDCDEVCECDTCSDEAFCPAKGVVCDNHQLYVGPDKICDHKDDCDDWTDEKNCTEVICDITLYFNGVKGHPQAFDPESPVSKTKKLMKDDNCDGIPRCDDFSDEVVCEQRTCKRGTLTVTLNGANLCTEPKLGNFSRICDDATDQINCTNISDVAMRCHIGGNPSTVSKYVICKELEGMCDDGMDSDCKQVLDDCLIHKHQLCDGVPDCDGGEDEREEFCQLSESFKCIRRYKGDSKNIELPIPYHWIGDKVVDCENGADEDLNEWKICGDMREPWATSFTEAEMSCPNFYFCANETKEIVPFSYLCDKMNSCGRENEVCSAMKNHDITTKLLEGKKNGHRRSSFCFPGLESLQFLASNCTKKELYHPDKPFGVTAQSPVMAPHKKMDCSYLYGETYVVASCLGLCSDETIACPWGRLDVRSCRTAYRQKKHLKTYAVDHNNEAYLSLVFQRRIGQYTVGEDRRTGIGRFYTPELFSCPNKKCIPFEKVCNLADDCGDGADENNCSNHFKCSLSREFIPVSSECDGIFDCSDASDECNDRCGSNLQIIESLSLTICAWTMGIMAAFLNTIAVIATAKQLYAQKSFIKLTNLVFVLLIAFGDMCVGIYLIAISAINSKYKADGQAFCKNRYNEWLSGGACAAMGVLSTFGSQLSLYAMTVLSLFRFYCTKKKSLGRTPLTWKIKGSIASFSALLILISLLISTVPLIGSAEDFFVNGLVYPGNPLLVGALGKEQHMKILQTHYGLFFQKGVLSWQKIRALVQGMFTSFNGPVVGKRIHFYGNEGVCLFKFFVTPDDPQRAYTWFIISQNTICFFIITFSYIIVHLIVDKSSKRAAADKNKGSNKNAALNRKITLMITTDFLCWIPFIIVCLLHYTGVMNATPWYALFSIVFIPLNSVINPLLYDTAGFIDFLQKLRLRSVAANGVSAGTDLTTTELN